MSPLLPSAPGARREPIRPHRILLPGLALLAACAGSPVDTAPDTASSPDQPLLVYSDKDLGFVGWWRPDGTGGVFANSLPDPRGVLIDGDRIQWADADLGLILEWDGADRGLPVIPGLSAPADLAWDGPDRLVADRAANQILRIAPDGGLTELTTASEPYFLAVGPTDVWFGAFDSPTLSRAPLGGGPVTDAITGQGRIRGVALSTTHLFWTDRERGTLSRAPLPDLSPIEPLYSGLGTPHGLLHVDGALIWTDTTSGSISRAPADGTGPVEVLVDGLAGPWDLAWRPGSIPTSAAAR